MQSRSFCYVDDLIDVITKLMNTHDDVTGSINIGNPVELTILELANLVIELTGAKSKKLDERRFPQTTRSRDSQI